MAFSRIGAALSRATPRMLTSVIGASRSFNKTAASKVFAAAGVVTAASLSVAHSAGSDFDGAYKMIEELIDNENTYNPSVDNAPGCLSGGGDIAPCLLRLAWHCAGTYSKEDKNGGSDGATMRFSPEADHGGNAGLNWARNLLEPVKAKYPGISYADLYIFAGKVAIESMGGPEVKFNPGRSDVAGSATPAKGSVHSPDGRLPDAAQGAQHLRDIFYRMGFNDREIVALSGAHSTGRCHTDRSGFWGPWSYSPSTFSNEYYRLLLDEKWTAKRDHEGKPWDFDAQPQYETPDKKLMMLVSDMALINDPSFAPHVKMYKNDEELFFKDFAAAWQKLTELGCNNLGAGSSGGGIDNRMVLGAGIGSILLKGLISK